MVFTKPGVVEMLDVDDPAAAQGDTLIAVAAAGICGSELHGISEPGFRQPPLVMGHEFVGTTEDGRRVVVNPIVSCGACDMCSAGHDQLCRTRSIVGIHRAGGFAERVAVPEKQLHALPDAMGWDEAALIEPLANALHVWRLAGALKGSRVGVIGAGPIGLVCLLVAQRDAGDVMITDLSDDRLALARKLGALETAAELEGEFDVVLDAVGAPATHRASVEHLAPWGTTVWVGLLSDDAGFVSRDLVRWEKKVFGSFAYTARDFADAVALASDVDLSWTTSFPLEDGATIFTELMGGRSDVVKAVLLP
jgi:alcohol dehydrogenase